MFDVWTELISTQFQSNECMAADWTNIMVYDNTLDPTPEGKPRVVGSLVAAWVSYIVKFLIGLHPPSIKSLLTPRFSQRSTSISLRLKVGSSSRKEQHIVRAPLDRPILVLMGVA